MDCSICKERSAVDSCAICHELLCEECGAKCETCGKLVCPQHRYTTHGGKLLCLPCQEKRRAAHRASRHEQEGAAADDVPAEFAEEEEEERPILLASARKPPTPWKLSLYTACVGLAVALVVLALPSLRRFALPGGGFFPTPYLLLIIPVMAVFWGVAGLFDKEHLDDKPRCFMGMGLALFAGILFLVAAYTDPARKVEDKEIKNQSIRNEMTPQELKQWRQEKMQKFKK